MITRFSGDNQATRAPHERVVNELLKWRRSYAMVKGNDARACLCCLKPRQGHGCRESNEWKGIILYQIYCLAFDFEDFLRKINQASLDATSSIRLLYHTASVERFICLGASTTNTRKAEIVGLGTERSIYILFFWVQLLAVILPLN